MFKHHKILISAFLCQFSIITNAGDFSGDWYIDLRTPEQRKSNVECGIAYFKLKQVGEKIAGDHSFVTPGCGRQNEGGDDTVKGIAIGKIAILSVTSGRNGAIALGKATLQGNNLIWKITDNIRSGEPEGDSPLILGEGILKREIPSQQ